MVQEGLVYKAVNKNLDPVTTLHSLINAARQECSLGRSSWQSGKPGETLKVC